MPHPSDGSCKLWLLISIALPLMQVFPSPARAASDAPPEETVEVTVEDLRSAGLVTLQERPFGFVSDPSTPTKGTGSVLYVMGFASGLDADRPLPANLSTAGFSNAITLSYGVTDRFAPFVSGTLDEKSSAHVRAGASLQITNPAAPLRVTVTGAVLREGTSGAAGAALSMAASVDQGPLRLAGDLRGEKVFASNRDKIDLLVLAGVSYRLARWIRIGAEYVGQDLEDGFEEDAEGGARHAVGPSIAFNLDGNRYQLTVASGFGIGAKSPTALVRGGLAFNF